MQFKPPVDRSSLPRACLPSLLILLFDYSIWSEPLLCTLSALRPYPLPTNVKPFSVDLSNYTPSLLVQVHPVSLVWVAPAPMIQEPESLPPAAASHPCLYLAFCLFLTLLAGGT